MTFIKCSKEITLISSGRQLTWEEECDSQAGWLRLISCGRPSGLRRAKLTVNQGRGGREIIPSGGGVLTGLLFSSRKSVTLYRIIHSLSNVSRVVT